MRSMFGFVALVSCVACSSAGGESGFDSSSTNNNASQSGSTTSSGSNTGSSQSSSSDTGGGSVAGSGSSTPTQSGSGSSSTCSAAAQLVYVVSEENDLYSFLPSSLAFTKIGTLDCPAKNNGQPFSMAVDRSGVAWVNYDDGELFRVSTTDASCTATSFTSQSGFSTFGMGFSTDVAGGTSESLYISGFNQSNGNQATSGGLGLAKLDTTSMQVSPIGAFTGSLAGGGAELTGSGAGDLFGLFEGSPAQLATITKTSGATPSPSGISGVTLNDSSAFAFSYWGGDFWFYTTKNESSPCEVTQYKASGDGSTSVVMPNVGFVIVGAGVSTCAPTRPVN